MKYLFLLLFSLISVNCNFSILPKTTQAKIPPDANKVILTFDMPEDSLFHFITDFILKENYRINSYDKEIGFFNTDSKSIGSGMNLRLNMKITKNGEGTDLSFKGEWIMDSTSDQNPVWRQAARTWEPFSKLAYERMVIEIQKLPYKYIQYIKEE